MFTDEEILEKLSPRVKSKFIIDAVTGCYQWQAGTNGKPGDLRGKIRVGGIKYNAHKFIYQEVYGVVTKGLVLDHLCRNKMCVNPNHLEPVTQRENTARGTGLNAESIRANRCIRGHEFTEENTRKYVTSSGGIKRYCRQCGRDRKQEQLQRINQ